MCTISDGFVIRFPPCFDHNSATIGFVVVIIIFVAIEGPLEQRDVIGTPSVFHRILFLVCTEVMRLFNPVPLDYS